MAVSQLGPYITRPAAADFSTKQYVAVVVNSSNQFAIAGAGAGVAVLIDNVAAGQAATAQHTGIARWVAGAAVAAGAYVSADASGRAVTAASGNFRTGLAMEPASGAGQVIQVLLIHGGNAP
jgi:hypothetical protein